LNDSLQLVTKYGTSYYMLPPETKIARISSSRIDMAPVLQLPTLRASLIDNANHPDAPASFSLRLVLVSRKAGCHSALLRNASPCSLISTPHSVFKASPCFPRAVFAVGQYRSIAYYMLLPHIFKEVTLYPIPLPFTLPLCPLPASFSRIKMNRKYLRYLYLLLHHLSK